MNKTLWLIVVIVIVFRTYLAFQGYSGDVNNHISWGESAYKNGFYGIYERNYPGTMRPTYPPPSLYIFSFEYWLFKHIQNSSIHLNSRFSLFPSRFIWFLERPQALPGFLKFQSIIADIILAITLMKISTLLLKSKLVSNIVLFSWLLNPAAIHNSTYWGQIEVLPLMFIFLSVLALLNKRSFISHLFFLMAIMTKQSALVFAPLFLLWSKEEFGVLKTLKGILAQLAWFYLIYIPVYGFSLTSPIQNYLHIISTGSGSNLVSDHAFNVWALYSKLTIIPDSISIFGFKAGIIGLFASIVLFTIGILALRSASHKRQIMIYLYAYFPLVAFMLFTRMHERYLEAALPGMLLSSVYNNNYFIFFALLTITNFLNLYHNWEANVFPLYLLNGLIYKWPFILSIILLNITILTCITVSLLKVKRERTV